MTLGGRRVFPFLEGLAPRDRRALLLGLVVAIPAVAWVFGVRPYSRTLEDVQDRVAAERELLARELALVESGPELPDRVRAAEESAARAGSRMLGASSQLLAEAELTGFLEQAASQERVLLEEILSGELGRGEEPPPGLTVVRLHLRGESDLEGILRFLDRIERSQILIRVRGLALEPEVARPDATEDDPVRRAAVPTGVVGFQLIVDGFAEPEAGSEGPESRTPRTGV